MATFRALGVDNAVVEIDGPEVPVMDGSAAAFIDAVDQAGIATLRGPPLHQGQEAGPRRAAATPSPNSARTMACAVEIEIDFTIAASSAASPSVSTSTPTASATIWPARAPSASSPTSKGSGRRGLALGASLENAVVIGDDRVINPEGLRFHDEFVRHKALDAIGDLALVGAPDPRPLSLLSRRP